MTTDPQVLALPPTGHRTGDPCGVPLPLGPGPPHAGRHPRRLRTRVTPTPCARRRRHGADVPRAGRRRSRPSARSLDGHGIGVGDRVGVRISSGTAELYLAILGVLAAGAAYVPVDADDPEERAELVFAEAGVCAVLGDGLSGVAAAYARRDAPGPAGPGRRRLDHLHLRFDRHAEGCRGQPRRGGGFRRRRGAAVPRPTRPRGDRPARPGPGRAVGGVRRVLRGDVAGVAARRLPGAGRALAGPQRRRPRSVAGRAAHLRGVDGADAGRAVAGRGAGRGPAADLRRRGVPAGAGASGWPSRAARSGTRTARPRRPWSPAPRG